jgi:anaerobic selenocysteine-containing dehydrogenase
MNDVFETEPGKPGTHLTYCRLCEAQCGLVATVKNGRISNMEADRKHPVSKGHLCVKGPAIVDITYDKDRVLKPLKRTGGPGEFEAVEWGEALDDISRRMTDIINSHGPNSVGMYLGNPASFSTQHAASAQTFIRLFGSNKVYSALHVDIGARSAASALVYGDAGVFPFPDLPDCDFLMILGGNPVVSHLSLSTVPRVLDKLKAIDRRQGVVVVDPRRTETARRFEHQSIIPDTDAWLLIGILKCLIEQQALDDDKISSQATGWSDLKSIIVSFDLAQASQLCGIAEQNIRQLATRFSRAKRAACYGRVGTNRGRFSTLTSVLIDTLNIVTGNFAVTGGTIIGHSAFAPEGAAAPVFPYVSERSRIGGLPLIYGQQPGGALAAEITTPGEGQLRALFLDSGNPVLSYPDGDSTATAFDSLDLMVSLDFYVTESSKFSDYILPAPTFVERADTNDLWGANAPEPWIQCVEAVIEPLGEARSEFDIYNALLARMGKPDLFTLLTGTEPAATARETRPTDVADFYLRMGPYGDKLGSQPNGLSFKKILREHPHGLRHIDRMPAEATWPRIANKGGKACLMNEVIEGEFSRLRNSPPAGSAQLRLFGRRLIHGLNSWMHNSPKLSKKLRPTLQIHPDDAQAHHIGDGQKVRLHNEHGEICVVTEITDSVAKGSVCYPHGFGHDGGWKSANAIPGANVNQLASSDPQDWEQVSGSCFLDGIPVAIEAIVEQAEHA